MQHAENEFDNYPNSALVHPSSDPSVLIKHLDGRDRLTWVNAAHACLAHDAFDHLIAMQKAGFDIKQCHSTGHGDLEVNETLLQRAMRLHRFEYDHCLEKMKRLFEIGSDPGIYNIQGINALGLAASFTSDLPSHRARQMIELLLKNGALMSTPCYNGKGVGRYLLDSDFAHEIISKRDNDLADWSRSLYEQESLAEKTPANSNRTRTARL